MSAEGQWGFVSVSKGYFGKLKVARAERALWGFVAANARNGETSVVFQLPIVAVW